MEEDKMLYQTGAVSKTIFDRTLKYLNSKYSLRFNTISLEFEIKRSLDKKWSSLNLSSLYIELIQSGIDIPKSERLNFFFVAFLVVFHFHREGFFRPEKIK